MNSDKEFLLDYNNLYKRALFDTDVSDELIEMKSIVQKTHQKGRKVIFFGNGGSAGIATHAAVDFTKQGGIRTINVNEPGIITCFANDYGFELWVQKALEFYMDPEDVVVLISSSGTSKNMVNAANYLQECNNTLITFTGHSVDNPLKQLGDINFWLDSKAYNIVENVHLIWALTVVDMIIGKAEYSV